MVTTLASMREQRSRAVSLDYETADSGTSSGPATVATIFPHKLADGPTMPVAFTDSTVPVRVLPAPEPKPHLVAVPEENKRASQRQTPILVKLNRGLQTMLIALCGVAIFAYGLDVVVSHDVGRLQEQARRLSEENTELSAQLLKAISYGELQDNVVGRFALRVPDQVKVVKEIAPPEAIAFKPHRHQLPLMSGY